MDLVFNSHEPITAAAVLFLADKLIQGEKLVSLTDRFGPALEKHTSQPEILVKVHRRLMTAQTIQQQFECLTGRQLTAIATHLASSSNHVG
jgi:hypothetical protein